MELSRGSVRWLGGVWNSVSAQRLGLEECRRTGDMVALKGTWKRRRKLFTCPHILFHHLLHRQGPSYPYTLLSDSMLGDPQSSFIFSSSVGWGEGVLFLIVQECPGLSEFSFLQRIMTMEQKSRPLNLHSSQNINGREKKPEPWCVDLFLYWGQFMFTCLWASATSW